MIAAVAEAGASAVKFQTYTADTLTIDYDRPRVDYNMLAEPSDEEAVLTAVRWALTVMKTEPFAQLVRSPTRPPLDIDEKDLRAFIRDTAVPGMHCAGSCTMGSGPLAVVDDCFSVHGV